MSKPWEVISENSVNSLEDMKDWIEKNPIKNVSVIATMSRYNGERMCDGIEPHVEPESKENQAIQEWLKRPEPECFPCGCLGPRNGEPVCPCAMQWVVQIDGEYFQIHRLRTEDDYSLEARKL